MRDCISEETLQAWFDGELAADEVANIAAHLKLCVQCAEATRTVEAENRVVSEGLAAEFAAAIPTERLRQRVETAVAALPSASAPTVNRSPLYAVREFFGSLRPLAYASIAAAILLAMIVGFVYLKKEKTPPGAAQNNSPAVLAAIPKGSIEQPPVPTPPVPRNVNEVRKSKVSKRNRTPEPDAMSLSWQQRQYDYAITKLNEAIKIQPPMRPAVRVEYEYNMAVVDNAIATSRDAARRNPTDPQVAQLMLNAYQSKVDLMNQIANARMVEK